MKSWVSILQSQINYRVSLAVHPDFRGVPGGVKAGTLLGPQVTVPASWSIWRARSKSVSVTPPSLWVEREMLTAL